MITLPRALARVLRAVLRRSVLEQDPRGEWPLLVCRAGPHGLLLEAQRGDVGLRYHLEGAQPAAVLAFRSTLLAEIEGRSSDSVTLEATDPGKARVSWQESGVPRVLDVETVHPDSVPPLPPQPGRWTALPESFRQALFDAAGTTARSSGRFSLLRIQLQGSRGRVVATDGRQLLIRGGFQFPWKEDLLLPRLPALGMRELRDEQPVALARSDTQVALRVGAWTFFLAIDTTSRFPNVQAVIPRPSTFTSHLRLHPDDADFLVKALPGLPGADEEDAPVTLDLGEQAVVRARGEGEAPGPQLELARSQVEGKSMRFCCNRLYLRRALTLGFRELHVVAPDKSAAWLDGQDLYLFMPLNAGDARSPGDNRMEVCSASSTRPSSSEPDSEPEPERRVTPMPEPRGNGPTANGPPEQAGGLEDLIVETEALRRALQEAAARAGRLASALRLQRRQSRAVQAAVATLRQLQLGG